MLKGKIEKKNRMLCIKLEFSTAQAMLTTNPEHMALSSRKGDSLYYI